MREAIIICGGQGTRMRSVTMGEIPKSLIEIAPDYTILDHILDQLNDQQFTRVILAVGHLWKQIRDRYHDSYKGIRILYSIEKTPLGTSAALKGAIDMTIERRWMVVYGDIISDIQVAQFHPRPEAVVVASVQERSPYGVFFSDKNNIRTIIDFQEKPLLADVWINAGIYMLDKRIYDILPEEGGFEETLIRWAIKENELALIRNHLMFWVSVDSEKALKKAKEFYNHRQVSQSF